MRMVIASSALLLAACAGTIDQNRERAPVATYMSRLPEPALEHCIAGKLSWAGTPSVIHGSDTTEIAFNTDYGTEPLITLTPSASETKVEVRLKHRYISAMRQAVEGCVTGSAN